MAFLPWKGPATGGLVRSAWGFVSTTRCPTALYSDAVTSGPEKSEKCICNSNITRSLKPVRTVLLSLDKELFTGYRGGKVTTTLILYDRYSRPPWLYLLRSFTLSSLCTWPRLFGVLSLLFHTVNPVYSGTATQPKTVRSGTTILMATHAAKSAMTFSAFRRKISLAGTHPSLSTVIIGSSSLTVSRSLAK